MRPEDFASESPGRLEPTEFDERAGSGPGGVRRVRGVGFVPDSLPPKSLRRDELLDALYDPLMTAERSLSLLEGCGRNLKNPHLLIGPFVRREARLSSAIENTFASAEQLALFEFDPSTVDNRDEVREVYNYVRALEHGLRSKLPVCIRLIQEMHGILLDGIRRPNVRPGRFRDTQNAIGREGGSFADARYVPPPAAHMRDSMHQFEQYIHEDDHLPRLVRFALIHYQFEAIHPFDDGNGRLGRLLIPLLLCEQGQLTKPLVYVSGYFEQHRQQYYDLLLRVSTHGDWLAWIHFFLEALHVQAEDAILRADRLNTLRESYYDALQTKRASATLMRIVDMLFERPSLTISEVADRVGINYSPASTAVGRLVERRILVEATGRRKNRVYVAPEILKVID